MNTGKNIFIIAGAFVIMFFALMVYIIFSAINGTLDGMKVAMAFIVLFFGLAIAVIIVVVVVPAAARSGSHSAKADLPKNSPMSFEASKGYCPNCGANLGPEKPDVCPECKEKVNKVL